MRFQFFVCVRFDMMTDDVMMYEGINSTDYQIEDYAKLIIKLCKITIKVYADFIILN